MKVEELLIDRYIVTAPYPQSKFEVGDILYVYKFETSSLGMYTYVTNPESPLQGSNAKPEYVESMPHLFRKLNWWEERKVEDMPEYVKGIAGYFKDKIYKIAHPSQNCREWHIDNEIEHRTFVSSANDFLPATSEQYHDYINSKSNAKPKNKLHLYTVL